MDPPTEMPCVPRASCQSISRGIDSRSSAPDSVKGVISGVMAPRTADASPANGLVMGWGPRFGFAFQFS